MALRPFRVRVIVPLDDLRRALRRQAVGSIVHRVRRTVRTVRIDHAGIRQVIFAGGIAVRDRQRAAQAEIVKIGVKECGGRPCGCISRNLLCGGVLIRLQLRVRLLRRVEALFRVGQRIIQQLCIVQRLHELGAPCRAVGGTRFERGNGFFKFVLVLGFDAQHFAEGRVNRRTRIIVRRVAEADVVDDKGLALECVRRCSTVVRGDADVHAVNAVQPGCIFAELDGARAASGRLRPVVLELVEGDHDISLVAGERQAVGRHVGAKVVCAVPAGGAVDPLTGAHIHQIDALIGLTVAHGKGKVVRARAVAVRARCDGRGQLEVGKLREVRVEYQTERESAARCVAVGTLQHIAEVHNAHVVRHGIVVIAVQGGIAVERDTQDIIHAVPVAAAGAAAVIIRRIDGDRSAVRPVKARVRHRRLGAVNQRVPSFGAVHDGTVLHGIGIIARTGTVRIQLAVVPSAEEGAGGGAIGQKALGIAIVAVSPHTVGVVFKQIGFRAD